MKTMAMVAMAAVMGSSSWAGPARGEAAEQNVTVCMDKGTNTTVVEEAQKIASKMFARIHVNLEWHGDRRFCKVPGDHVIVVSLSTHTPRTLLPGALAYALPYEGTHIEVFYDRMDKEESGDRYILAHVLVHEITHILQGFARHSETGVMQAHWGADDLTQMKLTPLDFTAEDVTLIRAGLKGRVSPRPGTLVAAAAP